MFSRTSPVSTLRLVLARVSLRLTLELNVHGRTGMCSWGYRAETIAALQAFRKRHGDAQRIQAQLASQPTTVDLEHYRSVLRNKAVVDEAEKILRDFKPVTYDVSAHIKAIETFETKAVSPTFPPALSSACSRGRVN